MRAVAEFRPCAVIPTYNNPDELVSTVRNVREHVEHVLVVDDGSGPEGRSAVVSAAEQGLAVVKHRPNNGGKGAAVKDALRWASELGFTHALQIDADGQHRTDDIPKFMQQAEESPAALILGHPVFDDSAPRLRVIARQLTVFWTHVETLGRVIVDPMCGFRVYPLPAALDWLPSSDFMDFDPEVAVRAVWGGAVIRNLPTEVRYTGGVSHFRPVADNVRISWMHTRLVFGMLWRLLTGRWWWR